MTTATASTLPGISQRPAGLSQVALIDAALLVATRVALWVGVQLLVAGLIVLAGSSIGEPPLNAGAGWWMVSHALIDVGTLVVLLWVIRRHGITYRALLGPPTAAWQVILGVFAVLAASAPAVFFSSELTLAVYGDGTLPMFAVVDVPPAAAAFSALVVPLLTELVEPVMYLGLVLPVLERRIGRTSLAAAIVVGVWSVEHAFFPILVDGGGIDLLFAIYRVISVLPFLAIWTALYFAFGRRLLPIMGARWVFNGGTAVALALGFA